MDKTRKLRRLLMEKSKLDKKLSDNSKKIEAEHSKILKYNPKICEEKIPNELEILGMDFIGDL